MHTQTCWLRFQIYFILSKLFLTFTKIIMPSLRLINWMFELENNKDDNIHK